MAWNEPGKNDKPGPSYSQNNSRKPDMPPDLDQVLKDLQQKLKNLLGRKKSSFNRPLTASSSSINNTVNFSKGPIIIFVLIVLLLIWVFSGLFIIEPAEKAAILRFGKYIRTEEPGLHWIPSLIETHYTLNVQQLMTYPYHAEMLTEDENIVLVDLVVQYRVNDLRNYLFNVSNPVESLQQATASALRQVIGQTTLDNVLTSGREKVRQETQDVLEKTLDRYHTGLIITDVNMQPAKPPEEVTSAFDDAIKAREDEQRFINQATTYANRVVPVAQGRVSRIMAEANAYQQEAVLNAQGASAKFLALLPQYEAAPNVTRDRLYLDAMQAVLSQTAKIIVDTPQSNNFLSLPLEQLMKKRSAPMSYSKNTVISQNDSDNNSYSNSNRESSNILAADSSGSGSNNANTNAQTNSLSRPPADINYPSRPLIENNNNSNQEGQ